MSAAMARITAKPTRAKESLPLAGFENDAPPPVPSPRPAALPTPPTDFSPLSLLLPLPIRWGEGWGEGLPSLRLLPSDLCIPRALGRSTRSHARSPANPAFLAPSLISNRQKD